MKMRVSWEHGSEFHLVSHDEQHSETIFPWPKSGLFLSSGRDAFRALLLWGIEKHDWQRVHVPSYFCQDVYLNIMPLPLEIHSYKTKPLDTRQLGPDTGDLTERDVVVVVNYFGLTGEPPPERSLHRKFWVIEDHTHDLISPWALQSRADYCFASLRKTLPLPDGGVAWTPRGIEQPSCEEARFPREQVAFRKLSAMTLKAAYLNGQPVPKSAFRRLYQEAEHGFAEIDTDVASISPLSQEMLATFPTDRWRKRRRRNYTICRDRLGEPTGVRVVQPQDEAACPFCVVMEFQEPALREQVRNCLISKGIYPAVLWPQEHPLVRGITGEDDIRLSERILTLHCDMRYGENDMMRVADSIQACLGG